MNRAIDPIKTRRKFLQMLSASPLLASPSLLGGAFGNLLAAGDVTERKFLGWLDSLQQSNEAISSPDQAFDVMDFEPLARKALPPAHFGYLATGVDDDGTVRANREGYSHIQIRARRLVDVENVDMSVSLFGTKWSTPIVLSPVSAQKAFHPEGEVAVARAAHAKGHLMMLSTVATASIEDATAAAGAPVWQQLYPTNVWEVSRAIVKRAEAAGSPAIVLTVDLQEGSNRETLFRAQNVDKRECSACHKSAYTGYARGKPGAGTGGFAQYAARKPMFNGLDLSKVTALHPTNMNWDFVKRLRDTVSVKLLIKGIVAREDAQLAVEHGVDGLIVSNHGGRAEETLRPTWPARFPSSWMAACGAARTFSRRSRWARLRSELAGLTRGDWPRLASRGLRPCWKSCAENCAPSCARPEPSRSTGLAATTSWAVPPDC